MSNSGKCTVRVKFDNDARVELYGLTKWEAQRMHSILIKRRLNLDLEKTREGGGEFHDWDEVSVTWGEDKE